ncbi:hypothetical protein PSPO01_11019 [Paraphaeosphaeria sporulosa]
MDGYSPPLKCFSYIFSSAPKRSFQDLGGGGILRLADKARGRVLRVPGQHERSRQPPARLQTPQTRANARWTIDNPFHRRSAIPAPERQATSNAPPALAPRTGPVASRRPRPAQCARRQWSSRLIALTIHHRVERRSSIRARQGRIAGGEGTPGSNHHAERCSDRPAQPLRKPEGRS